MLSNHVGTSQTVVGQSSLELEFQYCDKLLWLLSMLAYFGLSVHSPFS